MQENVRLIVMISRDSILRRLPKIMPPKQMLGFDGVRHAAEIATLAYTRLQRLLTDLALQRPPTDDPGIHAEAFLDAWAFVDAIDRIRSLRKHLGIRFLPPEPGAFSLNDFLQPTRSIRNVADHIDQRIDYILSRRGTALGVLGWLTYTDLAEGIGFTCMMRPGTLHSFAGDIAIPKHQPPVQTEVTGQITLKAGEYRVDLSDVYLEVGKFINTLEVVLSEQCSRLGKDAEPIGADMLLVLPFKPAADGSGSMTVSMEALDTLWKK